MFASTAESNHKHVLGIVLSGNEGDGAISARAAVATHYDKLAANFASAVALAAVVAFWC